MASDVQNLLRTPHARGGEDLEIVAEHIRRAEDEAIEQYILEEKTAAKD